MLILLLFIIIELINVWKKCYNSTSQCQYRPNWSKERFTVQCNTFVGFESCKGQPEVNLFRNVLWIPNLVRTLDLLFCIKWVKGHLKVK